VDNPVDRPVDKCVMDVLVDKWSIYPQLIHSLSPIIPTLYPQPKFDADADKIAHIHISTGPITITINS
jgi:hypothetical protein